MKKKQIILLSAVASVTVLLAGCFMFSKEVPKDETDSPSVEEETQSADDKETDNEENDKDTNTELDDNKDTVDKESDDKDTPTSNDNNTSSNEGTNSSNTNKPQVDNDTDTTVPEITLFEKMSSYFTTQHNTSYYNGYAETGFLLKKTQSNSKDAIFYSGEMQDGYGTDERGDRLFDLAIKFNDNKVIETVNNYDYMSDSKNTLNSIIPNFIIFDNTKTSWTQDFTFKGQNYTANTKSSLSGDKLTVRTTVNDIKGFYKNTYTEERVYEKNKGLISFNNMPYYEDESTATDFPYGYTYSRGE